MTPKKSRVDPSLEAAVRKLLKKVMDDSDASITDKMRVIDRALKLEQIKQKINDEGYGSGFFNDDDKGG